MAAGKSLSARVNVRWTGVRFGSEFSQLDTDHFAVPSLCAAIVPGSCLYVQCRKSARNGQSDFDLSPPAIAPRTIGTIAEDVLVAQLGGNVSGDRRKIVGIVESVCASAGQTTDSGQKLSTETFLLSLTPATDSHDFSRKLRTETFFPRPTLPIENSDRVHQ